VPERHVGEHAQLSLKSGKQASVDRGIHQVANEGGISPKTVREGIVFQSLFFKVQDEGGRRQAHVEYVVTRLSGGRVAGENGWGAG